MNPSIYICGTGNVASALIDAFQSCEIKVSGIYSQSITGTYKNIQVFNYQNRPVAGSIVIIAVPDDYIGETEKNFLNASVIAIHCSGSMPMDILQNKTKGVFYPLQTWTRGTESDWKNVPIFIESSDAMVFKYLEELCQIFGAISYRADSVQRLALHIAAVFANNFSNAVFDMAFQLANRSGFDPKILMPLIEKTVQKLETKTPVESQTGPAKRNDIGVMKKHLSELAKTSKDAKLVEIYQLLSAWILQQHNDLEK